MVGEKRVDRVWNRFFCICTVYVVDKEYYAALCTVRYKKEKQGTLTKTGWKVANLAEGVLPRCNKNLVLRVELVVQPH